MTNGRRIELKNHRHRSEIPFRIRTTLFQLEVRINFAEISLQTELTRMREK